MVQNDTPMTPCAHVLRAARRKAGYDTAADAARTYGWNYNTYSAHENGNKAISKQAAARYARAFRIPVDALLYETEARRYMRNGHSQENISQSIAFHAVPVLRLEGMDHDSLVKRISSAHEFLPVVRAPMGAPPLSERSFCIRNPDDSMRDMARRYQESFGAGDWLIFDPDRKPEPGNYVLAEITGEDQPVFRRLGYRGKQNGRPLYDLIPLNSDYATQTIIDGETGHLLGTLVLSQRRHI